MSPEVVNRQRRSVEREGRRRRRREERERREKREEHRQGMSTDDELLEMNRLKFENSMCTSLAHTHTTITTGAGCITSQVAYPAGLYPAS